MNFTKTIINSIKYWVNKQINDVNEKIENLDNDVNEKFVSNDMMNTKMNAENPVGTGSFSMNRKTNTEIGINSHAEGYDTEASGINSHAEGYYTIASSNCSHAEGYYTIASSNCSHAEGYHTIASGDYQHVQGQYNIYNNTCAHIVGNGTSDTARSNAHTIDWNGVGWFQGGLQVGGNAQDDGAKTVVLNGDTELILTSSTSGSTKKFKITIDDEGVLTATEIVESVT